MNIDKEREAFLYELDGHGYSFQDMSFIETKFNDDVLNMVWELWLAAKDHEEKKLEGCVVVPCMQPVAVVHNSGLGMFKECMVIYGWNGKSKQYQDGLNKGFYFGLKKGIQHVMEAARGGK